MSSSDNGGTEPEKKSGTVVEVLPNAMYWVRLESGKAVRAGVSPAVRHSVVRLLAGDRVTVKVSSHDPNRGQITEKL